MPFVNGRNYIEQNVTFYLKRQDPTGECGLLNYDKDALYKSHLNSYKIKGWNPNISTIVNIGATKDFRNESYL
jgi:hypothetical protein